MLRLADVVKDLCSELYEAIDAAATEALQFELGDIELELTVGVTKAGGTGGKVRFWVVELGAEGKGGNDFDADTQAEAVATDRRDREDARDRRRSAGGRGQRALRRAWGRKLTASSSSSSAPAI